MTDSPAPSPTFADLGVDARIRTALDEMGFAAPMEVQAAAIGPILAGRDVLVQARTGSGKTAAFAIPLVQAVARPGEGGPQVLVLEPTRELALQVAEAFGRIGAPRGVRVAPIYGGAPIGPQRMALAAGVEVVVGTPGRVLDHLGRRWLSLHAVRAVVLDEGDEMLSRGFLEDIERILSKLPAERQTLLFSATVSDDIARLAGRHQRDPVRIDLSGDQIAAQEVRHVFYPIAGTSRPRDLLHVLEQENPDSALIFCNTRDETAVVAEHLRRHGLDAEPISSDLTQRDRERVMARMKEGGLRYLVATDVAARGIDISGLALVVNYSFPESPDGYVHRTGRTGRAGRAGLAISLVGPKEIGSLYYLKLVHKIRPEERRLPTDSERLARREAERLADAVRRIPETPDAEFVSLARRVAHGGDAERIVAGLLQSVLSADSAPAAIARPARREPAAPAAPRAAEPVEAAEPTSRPARARASEAPSAGGKEFWEQWADTRRRDPGEAPDVASAAPGPASSSSDAGMVRLYVNLGRKEGITPPEIVALLCDVAGVDRHDIGRVQIRDTHSYVSIRAEVQAPVVEKLAGRSHKGRSLVVEPARR
jgi:ATP-dependent RNA helicase DeaD